MSRLVACDDPEGDDVRVISRLRNAALRREALAVAWAEMKDSVLVTKLTLGASCHVLPAKATIRAAVRRQAEKGAGLN